MKMTFETMTDYFLKNNGPLLQEIMEQFDGGEPYIIVFHELGNSRGKVDVNCSGQLIADADKAWGQKPAYLALKKVMLSRPDAIPVLFISATFNKVMTLFVHRGAHATMMSMFADGFNVKV